MNNIQNEMRAIAKELLSSGEASLVIGWEKGSLPWQSTPVMIRKPEDADRLIWDEYCQQNLSTYLIDYIYEEGKVAFFAKGCDTRAYNRLIQDNRIKAEKCIVIGVPCPGMKDVKAAVNQPEDADIPLAKACQECRYPNPVVFDKKIGEDVTPRCTERDFSDVDAIEALPAEEKYAFWKSQYTKCIRCYACRNICPACNCTSCIFDQSASGWTSKDINPSENQFYGVTRAFHVAGRCVECGQCEMVCPSGVPIMLINKKFIKDIDTLFGKHEAGLDTETPAPLSHFEQADPEEFM
ncbi:MAG: 4Fe-4S dicluster domain-containing protein [Firmicutes bacterium]|nr:4Fe-4S dicluster domain-containing protein [Bacillota bacterium]